MPQERTGPCFSFTRLLLFFPMGLPCGLVWPAFPGPSSSPALSHSRLPALCQSHLSKGCCLQCFDKTAGQLSTNRGLPGPLGSFGLGLWVTWSWTPDSGKPGSGPCYAPGLFFPTLNFISLVWSRSYVPLPGVDQIPGELDLGRGSWDPPWHL